VHAPEPKPSPPGLRVPGAFAAIYILWGSTYLALHFGVKDIPPFLFIAVRSLIAGCLLYGWARLRGAPPPTRTHWSHAVVAGTLLFAGGQAVLAWSQRRVASGISAIIIATIPIWMTLLEAVRGTQRVLTPRVIAGLLLGLGGIVLLAEPAAVFSSDPVDPVGIAALLLAAISWSFGSLRSRESPGPSSTPLAAGMSLLAGGVLLVVVGLVIGERITRDAFSPRAIASLAYLVVFGSLVAFASYVWLMKVSTPSRVSTYAFVNPIVALVLGWIFANESLSPRTLTAAGLLVGGVAAIVITPSRRNSHAVDRGGPERSEAS